MQEIDGLILFWEAKLKSERYLLEPSVIATIELTIKYLKRASILPDVYKEWKHGRDTA